ncbi:Na+/H+ antiporter subunit E [Marinobacter sp.]|uniref:Na+/H+ antiporter subunit E n=1 Tax=Marinobacter sp. TaxID=50741 RepID=UPI00384E0F61
MFKFRTTVLRLLVLYFIWWILTAADSGGTWFGLAVSLLVAVVSMRLFPPSPYRLRLSGILAFGGYFMAQSVLAGLDVARRLINPRLPMHPGMVTVTTALPEQGPRWLLANTLSLMPGTLTVTIHDNQLGLHCLDTTLDIERGVRRTERYLARAFGMDVPVPGGQG